MHESAGYLIDSNVLLDIFTDDPQWADWSADALAHAIRTANVFINPIVYAEVSVRFPDIHQLDERMPTTHLRRAALPYSAGFLAAKAHQAYRRRGGERVAALPDFLIGVHAVASRRTVVTRDQRRYASAFPTLEVVAPSA